MKFPKIAASFLAFTALLTSATVTAQQAYNVQQDRKSAILVLFGEGNSLMANVSINYGQPMWKADYNEMLGKMNGKSLRLGKDWWTTLVTAKPLMFGKKKIEAGVHYLGLETDKKGKVSLVFFDPAEATKSNMVPWQADGWKGGTKIPLELKKDASDDVAERMEINIAQDAKKPMSGKFSVRWGKHELSSVVTFSKK